MHLNSYKEYTMYVCAYVFMYVGYVCRLCMCVCMNRASQQLQENIFVHTSSHTSMVSRNMDGTPTHCGAYIFASMDHFRVVFRSIFSPEY
jgi:hypothetical protein